MRPRGRRQAGSQDGVALFMVISAVALLSVLIAELTYSTQMNARLAYNFVDNLKAYYLAKAAYKLSLVRLKAYLHVNGFASDPSNKPVKQALSKQVVDKIWSLPFVYPLPVPKDASMAEGDAIKSFLKDSKLSGSFAANISAESAKLNLNNLFITTIPASPAPSPTPNSGPVASPAPSTQEVDFRKVLVPMISSLIERKKDDDKDFADIYRNINGQDVVDAIEAYLFPNKPVSNLPGFKQIKPKQAPFYSVSELHLIPGIDDEIFKLLDSVVTVYSTPGLNVNEIGKRTLLALIPEMTDQEADDVLRKRDDPEVGQPWGSADDFWGAIGSTTAGKTLDAIKARFQQAGLQIVTDEKSFKISILANVGLSTRRIEAFVITDPSALKQGGAPSPQGPSAGPTPAPQTPGQPTGNNPNDPASAKKPSGVNLIYWRMI